nr:MAG TPA: PORTAL PROTEIN, 15 PROTEIN, HEAD PROTEIN, VIRAL INFECTION, TAILED.2A [Caudoviricetes sp.]
MNNVIDLTELKTMLGLADDTRDALLSLIIKTTVQALRFKLALASSEEFPSDLSYIALEVCVKRFNRLKNEGMTSYSQEGESITFSSNDFDDFQSDIDAWKERNGKNVQTLGRGFFFNPYKRGE